MSWWRVLIRPDLMDGLRPGSLTPTSRLHELGWAHSIEVWDGQRMVGGLYGISVGGLFAGESMFHHARDASKVALARLVEILRDREAPLLDVQWMTPHLQSLGAIGDLEGRVPGQLLARALWRAEGPLLMRPLKTHGSSHPSSCREAVSSIDQTSHRNRARKRV